MVPCEHRLLGTLENFEENFGALPYDLSVAAGNIVGMCCKYHHVKSGTGDSHLSGSF